MIEDGSVICWGGNDHGQRGQKGQGEGKHPADSSLTILRDSVLPIGTNENYLLSCGSSHTVCISKDKVYVWGNGADGQLGTGDTHCRYQPTCISLPYDESVTSIAGVSCGTRHTIVWTDEGLCYGFGSNSFSQLPLNTDDSVNIEKQCVPTLLSPLQHQVVVHVACGARHSMFLYQCGAVATVGDNNHGQLGVGSRQPHRTPQVLQDLQSVKLISSGAYHCMAVTDAGELYIWGYGKAIGYKHKDIVRPTKKLSHYTNIVELAGGATHSLALTENGNVYSWGFGADGQLGHGHDLTFFSKPTRIIGELKDRNICQIAASDFLSAALSTDGSLYIWGKAQQILLSLSPSQTIFVPTCIVSSSQLSLQSVSCGLWHIVAVTGKCRLADPDAMNIKVRMRSNKSTSSGMYIDLPSIVTPDSNSAKSVCGLSPPDIFSYYSYSSSNGSTRSDTEMPHTQQVSVQRDRTTLAEFYAPTSNISRTGLTILGEPTEELNDSAESIISPDVKFPRLIDATRGPSAASVTRSRSGCSMQRAMISSDHETCSATTSEDEDEEIRSRVPHVTITRNPSRVNTVSTVQSKDHAEYMEQKKMLPSNSTVSNSRADASEKRTKNSASSVSKSSAVIRLKVADASSLVDDGKAANSVSSTWNPYRNSIFNSNVFHEDQSSTAGLNAKMIGFLDMSDIQLVDKPATRPSKNVSRFNKAEKVGERHSQLYSKEMEMRNSRVTQLNTNYNKQPKLVKANGNRTEPSHHPLQKVSRRTQITGQRQNNGAESGRASDALTEMKHYSTQAKGQYRSLPMLSSNFMNRHLPRPVYPSVPDFSKAMTKLDVQIVQAERLKRL